MRGSGAALRASAPGCGVPSLYRQQILKPSVSTCCTRELARVLLTFSSSLDTGLPGRVAQGLEPATLGLFTPVYPLRPSEARPEEPPRSDQVKRGEVATAGLLARARRLEGGLAARKPQIYLSSRRAAAPALRTPPPIDSPRRRRAPAEPIDGAGRDGTSAERQIEDRKRAHLQGKVGGAARALHSLITNQHY